MSVKFAVIYISIVLLDLKLVASLRPDNKTNIDADYEYNNETELYSTDGDCNGLTFLDRLQDLHINSRTKPIVSKVKTIDETIEILKNLGNVSTSLFGLSKRDRSKLFEFITENSLGLSDQCRAAYYRIYESFNKYEPWALKFVDSIGAFPPSGFVEGVFADFGEYDECLSVRSPDDQRYPTIEGKYCISKLVLPFPLIQTDQNVEEKDDRRWKSPLETAEMFSEISETNLIKLLNIVNGTIYQLGICMPSVCTHGEVQDMLNKIFYPVLKLPIEVKPSTCQTKEQEVVLDNFQKISLTILTTLAITVIFCTTIELYTETIVVKPTKTIQLMQCFSIIKNTKALFSTSNKFPALDTMRLLLILNVHVVHAYLFAPALGIKTTKRIMTYVLPKLFNDWRYFWVKSPLMIDALFTLSGFLISYSLMRKLQFTHGRFNYLLYLFQNWARFVVIVFGSIMFYFVFPLLFAGPIWDEGVDLLTNGCRNPINLIKIFFFINNFQEFDVTKFDATCNVTLWFMSTIYQFIIISPIFIIIYYKRPRIGAILLFIMLVTSLIAVISPFLLFGIRPWMQRLSNGSSFLTSQLNDSINWFHTTPNNHFFSYLVGISFGLFMHKNIKISEQRIRLFWILSVIGISIVYYWNNSFWYLRDSEPQTSVLLWHTVGKAIYSISFGWIYFACCTERGGIFNKILSWNGFRPLTRISFGIYLLHYMIVIRRIFTITQTDFITNRTMIANLTIDFMFDVLIAYVFYILIESPFSNIFQMLFSRRPVKKTIELNNNIQNAKMANDL